MYEIRIPVALPTAWALSQTLSPDTRSEQIQELENLYHWFYERFGGLRAAAVALATVADYEKKSPLAVLALLHASKEL